jgi:hypothetical protein
MFEHVKQELLSFKHFLYRLTKYFLIATVTLMIGLVPGVIGFHLVGDLNLVDSLLNSLSLLGDINPPYKLETKSGQFFTATYGLFIETISILSIATLLSPVFHRAFHRLHLHTGK